MGTRLVYRIESGHADPQILESTHVSHPIFIVFDMVQKWKKFALQWSRIFVSFEYQVKLQKDHQSPPS